MVVVGGGNAGYCAAHAAARSGADVVLLEKAPEPEAGGNSYYTAGAFRVAFRSVDDLLPVLVHDDRIAASDVPAYPEDEFVADWMRLTGGRADPDLVRLVVHSSIATVGWLADLGVRWRLMYERQAYRSGDGWRFFGGLPLGTVDGGRGLMAGHRRAAREEGVEVRFGAAVTDLVL
ncbi:MAG TPA: FAD-dependent oxidoreductase, partial [Acidimicrobiales bacterium]|nr:FAD-dependent oxidoreductase [Acidimicrobiales bacterium]